MAESPTVQLLNACSNVSYEWHPVTSIKAEN